jgi:hypothetical protein
MATVDKVAVYTSHSIAKTKEVGLTHGGLILIALLSGGDYNPVCLAFFAFFIL